MFLDYHYNNRFIFIACLIFDIYMDLQEEENSMAVIAWCCECESLIYKGFKTTGYIVDIIPLNLLSGSRLQTGYYTFKLTKWTCRPWWLILV